MTGPCPRVGGADSGQTLGIYIVAVAALFFLAFAFFAVGQATSLRNSAQTAADAAALAAARHERDRLADPFRAALTQRDLKALRNLLDGSGAGVVADLDVPGDCAAAGAYAADNDAGVTGCDPVSSPPGYTVEIVTDQTVGHSAVDGTENLPARAKATAVIQPRCAVGGKSGSGITFSCDSDSDSAGGGNGNGGDANANGDMTIDPTRSGFKLDPAEFFTVHLSE